MKHLPFLSAASLCAVAMAFSCMPPGDGSKPGPEPADTARLRAASNCPPAELRNDTVYFFGDWDGDGVDNFAVLRDSTLYLDYNFDQKAEHCETLLWQPGDRIIVGDWDGNGKADFGIYRLNNFLLDLNHDNRPDKTFAFGNGNGSDECLVADFNGDGIDDIALVRDKQIFVDYNFDGITDHAFSFGNGRLVQNGFIDLYIAGDWDGDGKANIGVVRGDMVHLDLNFGGAADIPPFRFGTPVYSMDGDRVINERSNVQFFTGKWRRGNPRISIGYRLWNRMNLDFNYDYNVEKVYAFGNAFE